LFFDRGSRWVGDKGPLALPLIGKGSADLGF